MSELSNLSKRICKFTTKHGIEPNAIINISDKLYSEAHNLLRSSCEKGDFNMVHGLKILYDVALIHQDSIAYIEED